MLFLLALLHPSVGLTVLTILDANKTAFDNLIGRQGNLKFVNLTDAGFFPANLRNLHEKYKLVEPEILIGVGKKRAIEAMKIVSGWTCTPLLAFDLDYRYTAHGYVAVSITSYLINVKLEK